MNRTNHKKLKRRLFVVAVMTCLVLLCAVTSAQEKTALDPWQHLRFFVGTWTGTGDGEPGISRIEREYRFALNNKFLQVKNKSTYDPQPKNPKGEVHEDWGMIGFDKVRKRLVFRQFHVESFVIQYVITTVDDKTIVFTSENIENVPTGIRSRETYTILNADEFEEVFELAPPGKDFAVYSRGRFKRVKQSAQSRNDATILSAAR